MSFVTKENYWSALNALSRAQEIEAEKSALGEAALREWWRVAEPRWRELNAVLCRAESEDWVRASVWFDLWRVARARGVAPGEANAPKGAIETREEAGSRRVGALALRTVAIYGQAVDVVGRV
jgi:hypothetical protein